MRTIVGVDTSTTAFVGRGRRGPVGEPVTVTSFAGFERRFGGLASPMSLAVRQFFENGGRRAVIVRVARGAAAASGEVSGLRLRAASPGGWGNRLTVAVDRRPRGRFGLTVVDTGTGESEEHRDLSIAPRSPAYVKTALAKRSRLVRALEVPARVPAAAVARLRGGRDGSAIRDADVVRGVRALDGVDQFSLLCLPPLADPATFRTAAAHLAASGRRAMLLVDPPAGAADPAAVQAFLGTLDLADANAALYWPRLLAPEPVAPSGAVAGVMARVDAARGVWKAPAGADAEIRGVTGLTYALTDAENDVLNPLGINALRSFPDRGILVWGARTLGAREWKYVPVRRTALFIEESVDRGLEWAVFEPNAEPLWAEIRLAVGAFLYELFREGAFQGSTPDEAYFVRCDAGTTTQSDIDAGIVNLVVGFAPLKPAEFVVLRIQVRSAAARV